MAGSKSRLMLPYDKIFQSSCPGWAGLHATTIYRCPPHSITGSKSRTFISKGALIHHAVSSINLYKLGSWSQSRPYLFYPHFNNHLDLYRFSLFRWLWKCGCCLVSIIPTLAGWVYGSPDKQHQLPCFNHPNPQGLGQRCGRYIRSSTSFNHPSPRGLVVDTTFFVQQYTCVSIIPTHGGLGQLICNTLTSNQMFQSS